MSMGYISMRAFYLLAIMSLLALASCDRTVEEFDESKFGYDYFPLELGKYWVYDVDSTIYDDNGSTVIESQSQVKEEIVEVYEDEVGDEIFRIERYWRSSEAANWKVTDVWVASANASQALRTEENLKFIKFVFPALEGKRWNGNIYFDESTIVTVVGESLAMYAGWDEYKLQTVDQSEEVGGILYNNVATVIQTDDEEKNTVERRFALEKYARGVGLIYKENIILDSQDTDSSAPWTEKADKGFILKQTLVEYN